MMEDESVTLDCEKVGKTNDWRGNRGKEQY